MDTSDRLKENISAMVDNALPACEAELTLAALSEPDGRQAWHLYHLIGDTLRAQAATADVTADFAARLAMRLAGEEPPGRPMPEPADDAPATVVVPVP
jgi:sigma-E factor negative regulatory protein RseA